jgi:hypothetical protein
MIICSWSAGLAKNRINDVVFESGQDVASFLLVTTKPVSPKKVETLADGDPSVLMVRLGDVKVTRKWVKLEDKLIKRALVHPSKEKSGASVLRIRFFDKRVNSAFMKSVRIVAEDAGIRIDIPRGGLSSGNGDPKPQALSAQALEKAMNEYQGTTPPDTTSPKTSALEMVPGSTAAAKAPSTASSEEISTPNPSPIKPESMDVQGPAQTAPVAANALETSTARKKPISPLAEKSKDDPTTEQADSGLVFMPGVRTRDIVAGFTDISLRLEKGIKGRPGVRRIVVFPFLELDPSAKDSGLGDVSRYLLSHRLVKRSGVISADQKMLEQTISELPTDPMGRFAIDEARAAGFIVGADTLLIGTISTTGNGYLIDARAVDVNSGDRLVEASQEFDAVKFNEYADIVREERTVWGGVWRSALIPGWGQMYHKNYGRGITYGAIFSSAFISGVVAGLAGNVYSDRYTSSNAQDGIKYRDQANRAYVQANVFLAIAGLMWSSSVADSWLTSEDHYNIDPARFENSMEASP